MLSEDFAVWSVSRLRRRSQSPSFQLPPSLLSISNILRQTMPPNPRPQVRRHFTDEIVLAGCPSSFFKSLCEARPQLVSRPGKPLYQVNDFDIPPPPSQILSNESPMTLVRLFFAAEQATVSYSFQRDILFDLARLHQLQKLAFIV